MKPAPIQLLQVMFKKVSIEIDEHHAPEEPPNPYTSIFVFDGVEISTESGVGELDPDHPRGRLYLVTLRVVINNQTKPETSDLKYSPYLIDIEARGLVVVLKGAEQLAPPPDLAAVNGTSLLWSAVREQVLSITSRMQAGPVMLPTMNFHDLKQGANADQPAATAAKSVKRTKTKRSADKV